MEAEIALALASFATGLASLASWDKFVRLARSLDRFLYNRWDRYRADEKRKERDRAEQRNQQTEQLIRAQMAGRRIYPSDMAFVYCKSCGRLLQGPAFRDENNNCPDCAHFLSLRTEREIAIYGTLLQAKALHTVATVLGQMIEYQARKDESPR